MALIEALLAEISDPDLAPWPAAAVQMDEAVRQMSHAADPLWASAAPASTHIRAVAEARG